MACSIVNWTSTKNYVQDCTYYEEEEGDEMEEDAGELEEDEELELDDW